jgi:hypothetical protein
MKEHSSLAGADLIAEIQALIQRRRIGGAGRRQRDRGRAMHLSFTMLAVHAVIDF